MAFLGFYDKILFMEAEEKELIKETFELAKENNQMLKKVRGVQKRQMLWSVLKMVVIVGIAFGVFYFLEPYLNKAVNFYGDITGKNMDANPETLKGILNNRN